MKILHVITSLRTGGAEKLMVDLLPRLRDMGHEVALCVFDGIRTPFYDQLEKKGIVIHALSIGQSVYHPMHIIRLARLMKKFDIVHTHNTAPQLFAAIAHYFVPQPKLITTEHNTTNRRRDHWYLKGGDLWMYNRYCQIICISDQARDNLVHYMGESSKVVTIYNGIDLSRYQQKSSWKSRNDDKKVITMVAAFRAQKDHKTLIRAFDLLPDNYILQLVGEGEIRQEIEFYAQQFASAGRIMFMGNRNDVPAILSQSDVVVLSSHYEGLSLSSLEGMACGRPFIASDVDGLREIVSGYGMLVPHEDAQTLACEILKVTNDKELAMKISDSCVERAKQFDIQLMAEKYNNIYLNH